MQNIDELASDFSYQSEDVKQEEQLDSLELNKKPSMSDCERDTLELEGKQTASKAKAGKTLPLEARKIDIKFGKKQFKEDQSKTTADSASHTESPEAISVTSEAAEQATDATKEAEKKAPSQIFQGMKPYEDASLWSKMTFSFMDNFVWTSHKEPLQIEQYGEVADADRIEKIEPELTANWKMYKKQDPESKRTVLWAFLKTFQSEYIWLLVLKFALYIPELANPFMIMLFTQYIESAVVEGQEFWNPDTIKATQVAIVFILKRIIEKVAAKQMWFRQVRIGHRASETLRYMMFLKQFEISSGSNIQFPGSEFMQVAQHEAGIIWHFLWECGDMIFVPFDFIYGMVFLYVYMGVSMFSGFLMYGLIMFINFQTESINRKSDTRIRKIEKKKGAKIHESFEYSKTLKLFGWQKSFEQEVDKLRKEAREIHTERSRRHMIARNITGVVSEFLPLSIFLTFILMGHEVSLSLFLVCSALIDKIRGPLDRFMRMHSSFKHMDRAMLKIHRLLTIDEIQKNIVKENPLADLTEDQEAPVAVSIKGNYCWKIGEAEKELDSDEERELEKKKQEGREEEESEDESSDDEPKTTDSSAKVEDESDKKEEKSEEDKTEKTDEKKEKKDDDEKNLDKILTLKDIDVQVKRGEFLIILGKIGSGKTSLLSALLNDMTFVPESEIESVGGLEKGLSVKEQKEMRKRLYADDINSDKEAPIQIEGNLSYCEQQAWIQNLTIRDNILFGLPMDEKRYVQTVSACQLESDLDQLPAGEFTEIGQRGINLSGGQKARLSLARAVYKNADVVLMDDPISAVDMTVRKRIFNQVFRGVLKDKTRILVTHAVDFIHLADKVILMKDGKVDAFGTPEELEEHEYLKEIRSIHTKNRVEAEKKEEEDKNELEAALDEDTKSNADKSESSEASQENEMDSKTLALMNIDEEGVKAKLAQFKGDKEKKEEITEIGKLFRDDEDEEEIHKAKISWKVIRETFDILGGLRVILFFAFTNLASQLIRNFRGFYEKDFYMFDQENQRSSIFGFCGNILMSSIFCLALEAFKNVYWEKKNNTVEDNMYAKLFNKIMDAPVNLFFDVTPVDKVVGRFHRSMHTFKDTIVHSLCWIIHNGCECVIRLSLFAAVSYYMSALAFFVSITLLFLMYCWRKTAKNFWKMEHKLHKEYNVSIYQTFHGNAIIRCFGQEQQFKEKKLTFTNMWSQKDLVHLSGHFWQELRSDMVQTVFFAASCFFVIYYKGTVSPVLLSTVFFNSLDLGWIGHTIWGVNWFLENMDSAVWAIEMQKICPQEHTKEKIEIDDQVWPMEGKIEFKDVELKYRPETEIVLNKLSFVVEPGHKVGLCGRTGAGKSTISMAISRIVELFSGQIEIDGVDISKVDLHTLRSKITVIPQDPVLFTGTIRFNLDPYNQHSDEEIEQLIKKAGLQELLEKESEKAAKKAKEDRKNARKELKRAKKSAWKDSFKIFDDKSALMERLNKQKSKEESNTGIYLQIEENGKNLSVGERQLLCICRATLRKNKLVVLDEATSNIDVVTEQKIQKMINEEFDGATMLTIAHRLNTIINSDRIMLLDKGALKEFDTPENLMKDPNSRFSGLCKELKKKASAKEKEAEE